MLTIVISLIVGLGGGVIGALIAARAQKTLARSKARDDAATALWNFHRVLHDYALEQESQVIRDGTTPVTSTTLNDIATQRSLAYPYKRYLGDRAAIVERIWSTNWQQGMDPLTPSDDVWKWAKELEAALTEEFGKDKH